VKTRLKIKSCIGIIIALLIIFLSFFEIIDYNYNPLEYERVYHIGSKGVEWKYQNGQNFISWNIGLSIFGILYIITNLFYTLKFKKNKYLKLIIICEEIIFLIYIIKSLFEWYLIDFDY